MCVYIYIAPLPHPVLPGGGHCLNHCQQWAGLRWPPGGLRGGGQGCGKGCNVAQPAHGGPYLLSNQPTKYVIHTNTYTFNIYVFIFSFRIFFRASGATEAAAYRGRPIRRTYRGATAYTTASPGWPQHMYVNMYIFTNICMYFITIFCF